MIDDIPTNLEPAAKLGVTTVWVRNDRWASYVAGDHIDHVTDDLAEWLARIAIE
jgi:putative hydrolase of the HAD superfamily